MLLFVASVIAAALRVSPTPKRPSAPPHVAVVLAWR
jgi:hypothetical protein